MGLQPLYIIRAGSGFCHSPTFWGDIMTCIQGRGSKGATVVIVGVLSVYMVNLELIYISPLTTDTTAGT